MNNNYHQPPFVFFTFNDFSKQDGGPVRMYGILNTLAQKGHQVIFYSNAINHENFHTDIKHIPLNIAITPNQKRKIQFLMATFSYKLTNVLFKSFIKDLTTKLSGHKDDRIYFFEYLDNTVGYWLYKNKIIQEYVNDLHGIGPLEFNYQKLQAKYLKYIMLDLKETIADKLDRKVLLNAKYNIYASEKMYDYFIQEYPRLAQQKKVVIPNLLSMESFERKIVIDELQAFKTKYNITEKDFIIMFAGSFKLIGGVLDLIQAFENLRNQFADIKLLLIGDGPEKENCERYVAENGLRHRIIFTGKTPYHLLPTYQSLAHIIVCPEQENPYSHLIIHLKYLDALLSNKVVIAGNFDSIKEINPSENLSIDFIPSDIESLTKSIKKSILNYNKYLQQYNNNKAFAFNNLTYSKYISKYDLK